MKILLVMNKPNREIPIMASIRREVLSINPDAVVELRERFAPGFNRFVFEYKPDVIMTYPFTSEGLARWFYVFKYFLGAKIISLRAEGVIDFTFDYNLEWATGFDQYGETLVDYELYWGRKVPMGRLGQPEDIAPAVSFLLSNEARYITRHNLIVDGGWIAI